MTMAMAAALVPPLSSSSSSSSCLHPQTETAPSRRAGGGISVHRRSSFDFPPFSDPAAAAFSSVSFASSSAGRDGGACCSSSSSSAATARPCPMLRSRGSFHPNAAAADRLGWSAHSGGLTRSGDLRSRFSAAPSAPRRLPLRIAAEKPDLTNVAGTVLRLGKQGLEAGTKLVPESVPRPVAQAGVGLAGVILVSYLLKSLFSTVTFILAIGAVSYAGYFFLTKGDSSSSNSNDGDGSSGKPKSTDEALEEARKIMDKYK